MLLDDDYDWEDESLAERARVRVDLGTWVYPRLPFPYFFELGAGLVGAKDREEEREKIKKKEEEERLEKERVEKERLEKERLEKERLEKEEKERLQREKERLEREKAARASRDASKMEEGEIDEEEEMLKTAEQKEGEADVGRKDLVRKDSDNDKPRLEPKIQTDATNIAIGSNNVLDTPLDTQPPLDVETRTTVLIPSGYIPIEKPLRPRLWGGGVFDPRPRPPLVRSRRKGTGSANGSKRQRPPIGSRQSTLGAQKEKVNGTSGLAMTNSGSGNAGSGDGTKTRPANPHTRSRRPRRVYTDDSDIFLCAIHSGWLTWSGARKARARGRDLRIELRVLRCAGAGTGSVFAWGIGKTAAAGAVGAGKNATNPSGTGNNAGAGDPPIVKEEMVGRFVGGYGERCFNPLGRTGRVAGEDGVDELENMPDLGMEIEDPDMMLAMYDMYDDPEDDGRTLVSAAWGTGHDGSAIEIVGVEFVEVRLLSFYMNAPVTVANISDLFLLFLFLSTERNCTYCMRPWTTKSLSALARVPRAPFSCPRSKGLCRQQSC